MLWCVCKQCVCSCDREWVETLPSGCALGTDRATNGGPNPHPEMDRSFPSWFTFLYCGGLARETVCILALVAHRKCLNFPWNVCHTRQLKQAIALLSVKPGCTEEELPTHLSTVLLTFSSHRAQASFLRASRWLLPQSPFLLGNFLSRRSWCNFEIFDFSIFQSMILFQAIQLGSIF